ncbi:molybdenum cofactor guanylyltransferase [Candidatus Magnetomonas plexicatena]|uniref:molybdenum cofactor guanylyltransferase n=1 Tax=Candidatus Magnetomonas plexicatena TaxID=2552947 RepID=UPI0010FFF6B3|nr:molybdenum cofactor guanylyltransferase [Nitrospirales bacterium LBB_01]
MSFNMTGALLSGGENTRFPYPKGLIKIGGTTIMGKTLRLFNNCFTEVLLSTNAPEIYFSIAPLFEHKPVALIGDVYDIRGPMTGIFSCLLNSSCDKMFVAACDMPFVEKEAVELLVCFANDNPDYDAIVPVHKGVPEPLFAIYNKSVLPVMERALKDGRKSMKFLLKEINTKYIDEAEFTAINSRSFININTLENLKEIEDSH